MLTLEEYILTQKQVNNRKRNAEVDVFGGFFPNDPDLTINEAKKFTEATIIPKTPIVFDKWDTMFLYQFPPQYYKQALVWRYEAGLIAAAEAVENNQPIPETANIKFSSHGKRSKIPTEDEGKVLFQVKTFMKPLYEKLTKERNLQLLSESDDDYESKKNYEEKYGNYGFDLSDRYQDKDGHWHSKNFNFMNDDTAKKILTEWRNSIVSGLLHDKEIMNTAKSGYQSWGGGAKDARSPFIDWQGNLIDSSHKGENQGLYTAQHGSNTTTTIAKELGLNVSSDGKIIYKYKKGEEVIESAHALPVLLPGGMIPTHIVKINKQRVIYAQEYKQKMLANPNNEEYKKEYEKIINEHKTSVQNMRRRNEFQWNVSRYNLSTEAVTDEETGETYHIRKYPTMYANYDNMGGTTPTKMHAEKIVGSKQNKDVLMKWFLDAATKSNRTKDDIYYIKYPPGIQFGSNVSTSGEQVKNPVQEGVDLFLNFLEGSVTHGELYPMFVQMYEDVIDLANTRFISLAGDPNIQKFTQSLSENDGIKENGEVKSPFEVDFKKWGDDIKSSWKNIYDFILSRSRSFVSQLAQIDLGLGTRRDRESRATRLYMLQQLEPTITDPQQKQAIEKYKQQWQLTPEEQALVQKSVGINPGAGIRHDPRQIPTRGWPGHEVGGPRPAPQDLVRFAHSFEELNKHRAMKIATIRKEKKEGMDLNALRKTIEEELMLRYSMYDDYFFYDILSQMMKGIPQEKVDVLHAKKFATEKTIADLKASGVKTDNIDNIKIKGLSKSDEIHKNRILKELNDQVTQKTSLYKSDKYYDSLADWMIKNPQWIKTTEDKIKKDGLDENPNHPLVLAVNKAKKFAKPQPFKKEPTEWLFPGMERLSAKNPDIKKNESFAIYDPRVKPIDFQWAGDPKSMRKKKNVKKSIS